jgi:LytS/YehU family sensor histidine kinase
LFNALNSIKALTISDSRQARDAIMQLSDLLRLSLNLGDQQKAMLSEEIKLAQDYLALEKFVLITVFAMNFMFKKILMTF